MKQIRDIANSCSKYIALGLVDKVVNCISFMQEFNTQIKSVIDNYYLKENIPTTTADEVIRESMLDNPNLPSNVKIINNEIYRKQLENSLKI